MEVDEDIKAGYKQTVLGLIPEDWGIKKLKDVVLRKGEYGINASAVDYDEKLPKYLRITDIDEDGNFCTNQNKSVNNKDSSKFYVGDNDILFVRTGATVGKSYLYKSNDGKLVFAGFLIRFTLNPEKVDKYFIWSYTKSSLYWNWVKMTSMRSGQPGINSTEYGLLSILLPKLPEQKAIADCLSTWDNAIEKLSALIGKKELQKKALMQQLLTGKKRLKGFSGDCKEYKYSEVLKQVKRPVKWKDDDLYNLISVRRRSGGLFFRDALYGYQILVKTLFTAKQGDFLFSKMQIVHGASGLVTKKFDSAKISGSYIAVVAKDKMILNIEYLNWLSKTKEFYHQTLISSYGVHIEKMTFDFASFLALHINLPLVEEQEAIAAVLQQADKEITLLQMKLDKLKQQKKGLMQVLLTGKKRLKYE